MPGQEQHTPVRRVQARLEEEKGLLRQAAETVSLTDSEGDTGTAEEEKGAAQP